MNAEAILSTILAIATNEELSAADKRTQIRDYGAYVGTLSPLYQMEVRDVLTANGWTKTDAKEFVAACAKSVSKVRAPAATVELPESWPYDTDDGKLCLLSKTTDDDGTVELKATPICDFTASIVEEGTTEEGVKFYTIAGCAYRSGPFTVDIEAELFGDDRRLRALLEAAAGAKDPVRAGMAKHLAPAIKLMTNGALRQTKRYTRTGWQDGKFLIPGREQSGVSIRLSRKLPYQMLADRDISQSMEALDALVNFVGPEIGTVVMGHLFLAPMAHWAGWRNERAGLFIAGRTGTQKSTVAQLAMSIYGVGFTDDANLIKWGEGATRNAVMSYATAAHDLPLLIDNYKPSTGHGTNDFTNLVHNIMEGGDKERLNRAAQLKDTKPIFTWPVFTGEDVPDKDPASIARIIVTYFQKKTDLAQLTLAQSKSQHMPAIGATWIEWLESEVGQAAAMEAAADFDKARRDWYLKIKELCPSCVNPMRVATNLATNELTWLVLCQHPILGEWATRHVGAHTRGLQQTVQTMTRLLPQSLEANRFIDALREAIGSGRAIVIREKTIAPESLVDPRDKDRVIGWNDASKGIYLIPDITIALLQRTVGLDLGNLSKNTLYDQLDELGMIASKSSDGKSTRTIRLGGRVQRILHLANIDANEEPSCNTL